MIDKQKRLVTAEAVRRGHPDKLCDQIADAILDAHLSYDPSARVAVEVMATAGNIIVAGEVTSRADVNYEKTVLDVIQQIGYKWADLCEDEHDDLDIHIAVHEQSPDIAAAVNGRFPDSDQGAGDQGIMVGYATDETSSKMPRAFIIAQRICRLLDEEAAHTPWLGVDGKAQVSLKYEDDRVYVHTVVVSVQHATNAPEDKLRDLVTQAVYQAVGRADMWQPTSKLLVNPSGRFVLGGPAADTGLTGRKLAVDQYGPVAHIGGGALSGKDASKVDRSGAYAARWIARNLVAAKLCSQCEVSIVYAIGVCTRRREGFNEMIADALAGKIELIVTKSVSRFARNTVDSLTTIRELKAHGVEVYFQKENIYTFDGKGELLLTIMSSLAQEESRSISENVTWGIRKSFSDGKVSMNYKSFLGYRRGEDDMPEIVPEEAEIVQTIYRRFLEGSTVHEIAKALTAAGVPTPMKRKTWSETTVQSILTNEKYMGDAVLQKTFCTDFLTKKMKKNEGELPQYHVRNSHPAIVSAEVFELVQMEIESRRQYGSRYSGRGVFASKIVCADCGGFFGSKVWHSNDPYRTVIWRCNRKYEKGKRCTTPHVKEEAVKAGFVQVMARLLASKQEVLEGCRQILDDVLTTDEQSRQIAKLQDQAVGLAQRIRGLVNENARTQKTEDEFTPEYDRLVGQYEKLAARIATIQREKEDREFRAKRISLFMRMLGGQEECLKFDPAVFTAFVEKVVVSGTKKDVRLVFVLRDGSEYKVDGVR